MVRTSTVTGDGIDDLWAAIEKHRAHQEETGALEEKRRRRVVEEVKGIVAWRLRERAAGELGGESDGDLAQELAERRIDPYRASETLLERITGDRP